MHNGRSNEITFTHEINKYLFYPLTPSQVLDDQIRLKQKIKIEKITSSSRTKGSV